MPNARTPELRSTDVRAHGFHVNGVYGLARGYEQPVPLRAAEADVGGVLREADQTDAGAIGGENVDAVPAFAHPSGGGPDVTFRVRSQPVGQALLAVHLVVGKLPVV